eukprot:scaffold16139_cov125-Isochrysis_galbana.AAC.1
MDAPEDEGAAHEVVMEGEPPDVCPPLESEDTGDVIWTARSVTEVLENPRQARARWAAQHNDTTTQVRPGFQSAVYRLPSVSIVNFDHGLAVSCAGAAPSHAQHNAQPIQPARYAAPIAVTVSGRWHRLTCHIALLHSSRCVQGILYTAA